LVFSSFAPWHISNKVNTKAKNPIKANAQEIEVKIKFPPLYFKMVVFLIKIPDPIVEPTIKITKDKNVIFFVFLLINYFLSATDFSFLYHTLGMIVASV
jgi:hypothetical protein